MDPIQISGRINAINSIEKNAMLGELQSTKEVMREETELVLEKQKKIFTILSIVTLATILITIKIVQK